jgi:Protein of unknown function (DUF551)
MSSEWINIKDKKPPNGWLITAYKYYADPSICRVDFCLHFDGKCFSEMGGVQRDATHWMALPPPPENSVPGRDCHRELPRAIVAND